MRKEIDINPKLISLPCCDAGLFLVDVTALLDGRQKAGGSTPAHDDDVCTFPSNDVFCGYKLVRDNKVPTMH